MGHAVGRWSRQPKAPQVSDAVWVTTFAGVAPSDGPGASLVLAVPNGWIKERIEGRYLTELRAALADVGIEEADVDRPRRAARRPRPSGRPPHTDRLPRPARRPGAAGLRPADPPGRTPVHDINPQYTFDTFVIGSSNRFAHAAALAVAETPARKYNPLFIYGDAGLGKTHLLQAIAHYVRENYPNYLVRYVTSETFLNEFVDAVRNAPTTPSSAATATSTCCSSTTSSSSRARRTPGGVLPHLQPPPRGQPADRPHLRPAARRHRHPRGPAPQPVQDGA